MSNNYILCYRSEQGNRLCKTPLDEYINGIDLKDLDLNSLWNWEYLIKTYGENNLIILENKK